MVLTDELCDRLCAAAREKSKEIGIDISFAVCDESGLPRVYRRYGEALVLSITLVPGKAYTAAVTQCRTKDVAAAAAEGALLMAIQTNDARITLVAGGYPLFTKGKISIAPLRNTFCLCLNNWWVKLYGEHQSILYVQKSKLPAASHETQEGLRSLYPQKSAVEGSSPMLF